MRNPGTSFVLALSLLLGGCGSTAPTASTKEPSPSKSKERNQGDLRFDARLYNGMGDRSVIYFKLRTKDLLYKSDGGPGPYRANVLISYEAYATGGKSLLDSASTYVRDLSTDKDRDQELIGSIELKRRPGTDLTLKVFAHDLNRDISDQVTLRVRYTPEIDRNAMLPMDPVGGVPLFDDHLSFAGPVGVKCEQCAGRPLTIQHFDQVYKLPSPVFTEQRAPAVDLTPDSSYAVTADANGNYMLDMPAGGFLHIRIDTAAEQGLSLHAMKAAYPTVRNVQDMTAPLRYITSMQEWERITSSPDGRKAIEKFWTDATGDRDRARSAIRAYYSRVEIANREFTSFAEGWRTDRGLVYIIFGPPSTVRRTDRGEVWTYGEESTESMSFSFRKREAPYTDNDFELDRDPMFKGAWYRNVESWRNGRVYQN
jgi:GWxTD domain-containing protein